MRKVIAILLPLVALSAFSSAATGDYLAEAWNYTLKEIISGMDAADLNGDSSGEVIATDSLAGYVYVIDKKGNLKWKYEGKGYLHDVEAADLDSDNYFEILTNTNGYLQVLDHIGNRKWSFRTTQTASRDQSPIDRFFAVGDVNGDGNSEVVVKPVTSSCRDNDILLINSSGDRLWTHSLGAYDAYSMTFADVDNERGDEIIIGTRRRTVDSGRKTCTASKNEPGTVIVVTSNRTVLWEFQTKGGLTTLIAEDINDDGDVEVIVGSYPDLYVLDRNGDLKWEYPTVSYVEAIAVGDLDNDGKKEVIMGSNDVYVFSHDGKLKWRGVTERRIYSLSVDDIDKDGNGEVVAGSNRVYVFDKNGNSLWSSNDLTTVSRLAIFDMNADGYKEVIAGAIKGVHVYETGMYAKLKVADNLYTDAKNAYSSGNLTLAADLAASSKELYSELGLMDKVSGVIKLIGSISGTEEKKSRANSILNDSKNSFINGDFFNATDYANMARNLYLDPAINDETSASECENISINSKSALRLAAAEAAEYATGQFNAKNYEDAKIKADYAREIYKFLGESVEMKRVTELLTQIEDAKNPLDIGKRFSTLREKLPALKLPEIKPLYVFVLVVLVFSFAFLLVVARVGHKAIKKRARIPKLEFEGKQEEPEPRTIGERPKFSRDSSRAAGHTLPKTKFR